MTTTRVLKPVVFIAALVPAAILLWRLLHDDLGANPIEMLEEETGVWTLRFLVATLLVTPVRRLSGLNELIKYRRILGLFAFFYATVHLCIYTAVDLELDFGDIVTDVIKHPYVTVGMASWLLLLPLAITSTKGWIRRLGGARWRRLHWLVYAAAIGGCIHYLWAVKKDTTRPRTYLAIFSVLLAYRVMHWMSTRRPREPSR